MKILNKISLFMFVILTLFMSVYSSAFAFADDYVTVEEEIPYDYNTSSVIADLNNGNEVSENEFFPAKYLSNVFGADNLDSIRHGNYTYGQDLYVISFIENGYGTSNFGIYLYVYNPKDLILTISSSNKVQFSFSGSENDVFRSQYSKYNVDFVNKTENNFYWKFKVRDFTPQNYSKRYYAVSGIELLTSLSLDTTEYAVGSVYFCKTQDGKTTVSRKPLSTIDVDCTHVFYRTDDSEKGKGWSNQLSACYFALPKEYSFGNNPFGSLTEVLAEFNLRYTTPILLLNNRSVYNDFYKARGVPVSNAGFQHFFGNLCFGSLDYSYPSFLGSDSAYYYAYGYNLPSLEIVLDFFGFHTCGYFTEYNINTLNWVFCDEGADFDNEDYYFPTENLLTYYRDMNNRGLQFFEDYTYFDEHDISLCGFNYGYNQHTYSISQEPEQGAVLGYELTFDNHGFWESIAEFFGFNQTQTVTGIAPLVRVEYYDVVGRNALTEDAFSEKHLVAKHQVRDLQDKVRNCGNEQEVWLFRYDCSEYYGAKAEVYDQNISNDKYDGLVCQEPVYLSWDILSFTFEQKEIDTETQTTKIVKTIVPVNHSPEDVFSDLTRSKNDFPDDSGCSCADYKTMFTWLLFFGGAFVVWLVVTKIIKHIRR